MYAHWLSRRDMCVLIKTKGHIIDAQLEEAIRSYGRKVLETSKVIILIYWILNYIYIYILIYDILLEQAQAATTRTDVPTIDDPLIIATITTPGHEQ